MRVAYRLCSSRYPANSGRGAELHGGRWNPVGIPVIYAASNASLAALEILVNYSFLPRDFALTEIQIPDNVTLEVISNNHLPAEWDSEIPIAATQEIGHLWVKELRSAVLSLPSSIIGTTCASERNLVMNSNHPDFATIQFSEPSPFQFDPRLK